MHACAKIVRVYMLWYTIVDYSFLEQEILLLPSHVCVPKKLNDRNGPNTFLKRREITFLNSDILAYPLLTHKLLYI